MTIPLARLDLSSAGQRFKQLWELISPLPGGKLLYSRLIGVLAPYTGTIRPCFLEIRPGFARAQIREHRRIKNHVNSIHAIALMNLAEATTGLAMMFAIPEGSRGIPVRLCIDYHKKGRGVVTAEAHCDPPRPDEHQEGLEVHCTIRDQGGELVASAVARWNVGPASR